MLKEVEENKEEMGKTSIKFSSIGIIAANTDFKWELNRKLNTNSVRYESSVLFFSFFFYFMDEKRKKRWNLFLCVSL